MCRCARIHVRLYVAINPFLTRSGLQVHGSPLVHLHIPDRSTLRRGVTARRRAQGVTPVNNHSEQIHSCLTRCIHGMHMEMSAALTQGRTGEAVEWARCIYVVLSMVKPVRGRAGLEPSSAIISQSAAPTLRSARRTFCTSRARHPCPARAILLPHSSPASPRGA